MCSCYHLYQKTLICW